MGVNCVYLSANAPPSSSQPCSVERRLREGSFRNPKVLTLEMGSNSNLRGRGSFLGTFDRKLLLASYHCYKDDKGADTTGWGSRVTDFKGSRNDSMKWLKVNVKVGTKFLFDCQLGVGICEGLVERSGGG